MDDLVEIARAAVAAKDTGNDAAAWEHLARIICEFFAAQKFVEIVKAAADRASAAQESEQ